MRLPGLRPAQRGVDGFLRMRIGMAPYFALIFSGQAGDGIQHFVFLRHER